MEPEEDELVAEFDVEVSKQPAGAPLYLLGFPLRPRNVPLGTERRVVEGRFRPKQRRIELDLELETKNKLENTITGFGDMDIEDGGSGMVFDPVKMEKMPMKNRQTFAPTCNMPPPKANYTAGLLDLLQKKLVVAPLDNVTQLQPQFAYIDKEVAEKKKEREESEKLRKGGAKGPDTSDDEEKEGAAVEIGVSFKKRETEQAAERRKHSYAYIMDLQEKEKWIKLEYALEDREDSKEAFHRAFNTVGLPKTPFTEDASYITNLGGRVKSKKETFATPLALRELRSMQATELIPEVMRRVKIIDYRSMWEICEPLSVSEALVVTNLEKCAALLRGTFVVRSSCLGLSSRLSVVRDLILSQFRESSLLRVADIVPVLGFVEASVLTGFLSEVATKTEGHGWSFKFAADEEFIQRHPDLASSHLKQWDSREQACLAALTK